MLVDYKFAYIDEQGWNTEALVNIYQGDFVSRTIDKEIKLVYERAVKIASRIFNFPPRTTMREMEQLINKELAKYGTSIDQQK